MSSAGRRTFSLTSIAAAALLLVGCAGSQSQMRVLENDNAIRIEPSRLPGSDYDVTIRNLRDFGFNPDEKSNRDEYALRLARAQCSSARIIGEEKIETGTFLLGNPSRSYVLHISCKP